MSAPADMPPVLRPPSQSAITARDPMDARLALRATRDLALSSLFGLTALIALPLMVLGALAGQPLAITLLLTPVLSMALYAAPLVLLSLSLQWFTTRHLSHEPRATRLLTRHIKRVHVARADANLMARVSVAMRASARSATFLKTERADTLRMRARTGWTRGSSELMVRVVREGPHGADLVVWAASASGPRLYDGGASRKLLDGFLTHMQLPSDRPPTRETP